MILILHLLFLQVFLSLVFLKNTCSPLNWSNKDYFILLNSDPVDNGSPEIGSLDICFMDMKNWFLTLGIGSPGYWVPWVLSPLEIGSPDKY